MSAFVSKGAAAAGRRAARALSMLLAMAAFAAASASLAQNVNGIDAVSVAKGQGRTVVRFQLKAPPSAPPAGFAIANPPRVALDFLDTTNGLGRTVQEIADPTLRSVNVVQAGTRT